MTSVTVAHLKTSCVQPNQVLGLTLLASDFSSKINKKNTESCRFSFTKPLSKNLGDGL